MLQIKKIDINNTPEWDNINKLSPPPILKYSPSTVNTDDYFIKSELVKNSKVDIPDTIVEKESIKLLKAKMKSELERKLKNMRHVSQHNNYVVMGEKELNGTFRFLAEGFASWGECNELLQLAQVAAVQGDGYNGKSPHTDHEKFEGVTLGRAALLVYFGLMETRVLEMFLKLSERVKNYVERYFNVKEKLYFTFTHLVCRSAIDSTGLRNKTDLSHAIHADNCNLQANGECIFAHPAYTWRSYSAILYLNDDFEGGEFIFASDIKAANIQSLVQPKCGRLVGFSSGKENLHGVKGVLRGSRCALGLWFTFDHKYQEIERILAEQVLVQVQKQGTISDKLVAELQKHVPTN
ncbi:hypothetical protein B566_EDAN001150 [Ephemera danica]|nr:hypothetical protein B566_EDAN001150 [Ephemera danica]